MTEKTEIIEINCGNCKYFSDDECLKKSKFMDHGWYKTRASNGACELYKNEKTGMTAEEMRGEI